MSGRGARRRCTCSKTCRSTASTTSRRRCSSHGGALAPPRAGARVGVGHRRAGAGLPRRRRRPCGRSARRASAVTCSSSTPPTRPWCGATASRGGPTRWRRSSPGEELLRLIHTRARAPRRPAGLADQVIDTTRLTCTTSAGCSSTTSAGRGGHAADETRVLSFGFKYGVPVDADLVFDARFLPNPHFVPALRPRSGRDPAVAAFVLGSVEGREFLDAHRAGSDPAPAAVRAGGQGGADRGRRVHRREAPLGGPRRGAGERLREAGPAGRSRQPPRHRPGRLSEESHGATTPRDLRGDQRAGLHARPATRSSRRRPLPLRGELERDGPAANAKSVMGVLLLGCHKGSRVTCARAAATPTAPWPPSASSSPRASGRAERGRRVTAGVTRRLGIAASPGVVMGRAFVVDRRRMTIPRRHIEEHEVEGEVRAASARRFASARRSSSRSASASSPRPASTR
jgi:hypothetical protein